MVLGATCLGAVVLIVCAKIVAFFLCHGASVPQEQRRQRNLSEYKDPKSPRKEEADNAENNTERKKYVNIMGNLSTSNQGNEE